VGLLGANAHGEILEPGREPDCYLGLLLDQPGGDAEVPGAGGGAGLAAAACCSAAGRHRRVWAGDRPSDRAPGELVFLADLTVELRAWPYGTWARLGVDPQAAASAVVSCWRHGHLPGRQYGADHGGHPGVGAAGVDLGAGMAPRPARPPAQPDGPAVVASSQRTPAGRGVAVALAAVSAVDSSRPDTRPWFGKQQRTADAGCLVPQTAGHAQGLVSAVDCGRPPHKPGRSQWPSQQVWAAAALRACWSALSTRTGGAPGGHPGSGQVDRWRGLWTPLVRTARCCGLPQVRQVAWEHRGSGPPDSRQRNIHQYRTHDHAGRCRTTQPWTADFKWEGRSLRGARSPDL
jgi:hypothetical protein